MGFSQLFLISWAFQNKDVPWKESPTALSSCRAPTEAICCISLRHWDDSYFLL